MGFLFGLNEKNTSADFLSCWCRKTCDCLHTRFPRQTATHTHIHTHTHTQHIVYTLFWAKPNMWPVLCFEMEYIMDGHSCYSYDKTIAETLIPSPKYKRNSDFE